MEARRATAAGSGGEVLFSGTTILEAAFLDGVARKRQAILAAETGMAVLRVSFERWVSGPEGEDLGKLLRDSFDELKSVAG